MCTVTPPLKGTYTEGHKYDWTHFLLQILDLFASYDPVWTIFMIFVISVTTYGWFRRYYFQCDLLWHIKCPAKNFRPPHWILPYPSLFLLLRVTVRPIRRCLRPKSKATVNKKGEFPNSSTLKIYFSLCVNFCLFVCLAKNKWRVSVHFYFILLKTTCIHPLQYTGLSLTPRFPWVYNKVIW